MYMYKDMVFVKKPSNDIIHTSTDHDWDWREACILIYVHIFLGGQVVKTVKQFLDKGRSRQSMLLFGHGDGGGGPT